MRKHRDPSELRIFSPLIPLSKWPQPWGELQCWTSRGAVTQLSKAAAGIASMGWIFVPKTWVGFLLEVKLQLNYLYLFV